MKYSGKSDSVKEAMLRHDATVLYTADLAVQKKVDRDIAIVSDQEAREGAEVTLGPKLLAWAEDKGVKKNIRTLLATLHTVLSADSGWKEVSMGDLLSSGRVTFHYKKAMLRVHPDKNMDRSPQDRFITQRAFDVLNQAYAAFEAGGAV